MDFAVESFPGVNLGIGVAILRACASYQHAGSQDYYD